MTNIENNFNVTLDESLERLSKNLYLESPDLWIEFSGKISDNIFDEMVLFFAIKFNFPAIVAHAVDNNLIDLNAPSRNNTYSSIREHLTSIAESSHNLDIIKYLEGSSSSNDNVDVTYSDNSKKDEVEATNTYMPKYVCESCNHNVFESGYKVSESIEYKYLPSTNQPTEISRSLSDSIYCCNCNNKLQNISLDKLNELSSIQNCTNCGSNLTSVGITEKSRMSFDNSSDKFDSVSKSYHCSNCDFKISDIQKDFFKIK